MTDPLISTEALAAALGAPDLRILDASWFMDHRDARIAWREGRLPGAVFFDIDAISDTSNPLPHMLPSPQAFAEAVGALGISEGDHIVVYDQQGLMSAARVWWTFRVFGAARVQVLDGGLPQWLAEGRPVETGEPSPKAAAFTPTFHPELVADAAEVLGNIDAKAFQLIDARSEARFLGQAAEPRAGVRSGRVPGSFNVPFGEVLEPDATMKPAHELARVFQMAGVDPAKPTVGSCGSGITASILALALARMGHWNTRVYDGSWSEWGSRADLPILP